jgi:hypothetical protein
MDFADVGWIYKMIYKVYVLVSVWDFFFLALLLLQELLYQLE